MFKLLASADFDMLCRAQNLLPFLGGQCGFLRSALAACGAHMIGYRPIKGVRLLYRFVDPGFQLAQKGPGGM